MQISSQSGEQDQSDLVQIRWRQKPRKMTRRELAEVWRHDLEEQWNRKPNESIMVETRAELTDPDLAVTAESGAPSKSWVGFLELAAGAEPDAENLEREQNTASGSNRWTSTEMNQKSQILQANSSGKTRREPGPAVGKDSDAGTGALTTPYQRNRGKPRAGKLATDAGGKPAHSVWKFVGNKKIRNPSHFIKFRKIRWNLEKFGRNAFDERKEQRFFENTKINYLLNWSIIWPNEQ
jgi:hypothetical protein